MSLMEAASRPPVQVVKDIDPKKADEVINTALARHLASMMRWANQPGNHIDPVSKDHTMSLIQMVFGLTSAEVKNFTPEHPSSPIPLEKVMQRR